MLTLPYGSWPTPITSELVIRSARLPTGFVSVDGEDVWWSESRPEEAGRTAVLRRRADGRVDDVLPAPANARTAVHEYGGGAWWVREDDYRTILARYHSGRLGFGTVARSAVAVQPSWSDMDVSIKAYLVRDVNVYIGKAVPQYRDQLPNGMFVTIPGWPDIDQVYIPDIQGTAFYALRIVRQKTISTDDFGF